MYTFACVNTKTHFSHHTKKRKEKREKKDRSTVQQNQQSSEIHRFERYIDLDASIDAACQNAECIHQSLDPFDILCARLETLHQPFYFYFFSCVLLEFAKKKDVTPLMGERSRAIVRLVQPRIFSTSDVILCNFINTTSPLILNFSSDQKYFFLYRVTPFFPAFAFAIVSSMSSPRLYLSLFSAKF